MQFFPPILVVNKLNYVKTMKYTKLIVHFGVKHAVTNRCTQSHRLSWIDNSGTLDHIFKAIRPQPSKLNFLSHYSNLRSVYFFLFFSFYLLSFPVKDYCRVRTIWLISNRAKQVGWLTRINAFKPIREFSLEQRMCIHQKLVTAWALTHSCHSLPWLCLNLLVHGYLRKIKKV